MGLLLYRVVTLSGAGSSWKPGGGGKSLVLKVVVFRCFFDFEIASSCIDRCFLIAFRR